MPRKSRTDRELGWLSNVWEELAAAELRHAAFASIEIRPAAVRRTFTIRITMTRPETTGGYPGWSYSTMVRYPNGDATEFLAWLWGRCDRFSDEAALSDEAIKAPQTNGF